jgi:ABC-2 type transport system ATP-binding protein
VSDRETVIRVEHVTMDFRRAQRTAGSIKELLLKGQGKRETFRALDDVSFQVEQGQVVGIVGTNGSGKSTLLKIIAGALSPTRGRVEVDRDKVQLLTLGTGFDPELTGRENLFLNGALIGRSRQFLNRRYRQIVNFAELEGFMEERVRNYSSGMVSRLGFAIATAGEAPEILILDEVLSVGDMFFRKKSEARIREMIHSGSTVLIVSHSPGVVRENCTRALWLDRGKLLADGDPKTVCAAYEKSH